jgi:hypothetical protein
MATILKNPNQRTAAAALKEERVKDAALAMQEYRAEKAAFAAKTARLRALRLVREAENRRELGNQDANNPARSA